MFVAIYIAIAIAGNAIVATELEEEGPRVFDSIVTCEAAIENRINSAQGQVQTVYGLCLPLRKNLKQNWKGGSSLQHDEI